MVTDLSSALVLHRSIVEDLNRTIVALGIEKVTHLQEICQLRKGIAHLKWYTIYIYIYIYLIL